MSSTQKIIKYVAIGFAIFLIVNIVSGMTFGLHIFANIVGLNKKEDTNQREIITEFETNSDIATLKVELECSNLTIKKGNILKAESDNKYITCKQDKNQLIIKEDNPNWFFNNRTNYELTIYIPENLTFDTIQIKTGAGKTNIENLNTKSMLFELGAGKVEIQNLIITEKANIKGGVGKVDILKGSINNLDLEVGIGSFELTTKLTGKNDISAGIGKLDIKLLDKKENYNIKATKGIGSIKIDGDNVSEENSFGNGESSIKIDGGIGSINVSFED